MLSRYPGQIEPVECCVISIAILYELSADSGSTAQTGHSCGHLTAG